MKDYQIATGIRDLQAKAKEGWSFVDTITPHEWLVVKENYGAEQASPMELPVDDTLLAPPDDKETLIAPPEPTETKAPKNGTSTNKGSIRFGRRKSS